MRGRTLRNVLVSLVVGGLFLFMAMRNIDQEHFWAAMSQFDGTYLIPAVLISLTLQVFRAWRWQLELRPLERIGLGKLWVVVSVAYMAINVLPARLGEFVRPWLLSKRSSVTFSNVVGNLVLEKTIDSTIIVFFILIGLITTPNLPEWVRRLAMVPAFGALTLVLLVAAMWFKGEAFVDGWIARRLPEKFGATLSRVLRAFLDGMRILPDGHLLGAVLVMSLVYWSLPILSSWVILRAFSIDVPVNAALIVFIFIGFGTALPNAPGMVGVYQYACVLALGLFGVEKSVAFAYGVMLNAIQLTTLIAQGVVALPFAGVGLSDFVAARRDIEQDSQKA